MVDRDKALRGRAAKMMVDHRHAVHGTPMDDAFPGKEMAVFAKRIEKVLAADGKSTPEEG